ncbi:keratin, type II cytoskeletal I-like isoform X2 [Hyperolius riggenbachi]
MSCLEKALNENKSSVSVILIEFLCSLEKGMPSKDEIMSEIQKIEEVTSCTTNNLFESDANIEELVMDTNGTLKNFIQNVKRMLRHVLQRDLPRVATCLSMDIVKNNPEEHKRLTRGIGGLFALLSSLTGALDTIDPVLNLAGGLTGGLLGSDGLLGGILGNGRGGGMLSGLLGGGNGGGLLNSVAGGKSGGGLLSILGG